MKKNIAIILELLPVISAPVSYLLIFSKFDSPVIRSALYVTMGLAFLGFAFFLIARKIDRESKAVKILGIFDVLATVSVIAFYVIAIFSFAL